MYLCDHIFILNIIESKCSSIKNEIDSLALEISNQLLHEKTQDKLINKQQHKESNNNTDLSQKTLNRENFKKHYQIDNNDTELNNPQKKDQNTQIIPQNLSINKLKTTQIIPQNLSENKHKTEEFENTQTNIGKLIMSDQLIKKPISQKKKTIDILNELRKINDFNCEPTKLKFIQKIFEKQFQFKRSIGPKFITRGFLGQNSNLETNLFIINYIQTKQLNILNVDEIEYDYFRKDINLKQNQTPNNDNNEKYNTGYGHQERLAQKTVQKLNNENTNE